MGYWLNHEELGEIEARRCDKKLCGYADSPNGHTSWHRKCSCGSFMHSVATDSKRSTRTWQCLICGKRIMTPFEFMGCSFVPKSERVNYKGENVRP